MNLDAFNKKDKTELQPYIMQCCGSSNWVDKMLAHFPFSSELNLVNIAAEIWYQNCSEKDWLEAFQHHPKIGDLKSLEKKFASTSHLTNKEQAGVQNADKELIANLAKANQAYEAKFDFIFIVCATGKSAAEMLRLLNDRLANSKAEELEIAMGEQHKITVLRMKKLLKDADWIKIKGSHITTHVLDTSLGKPGGNMTIKLQYFNHEEWQTMTQGVTNLDGRIADLLPSGKLLKPGNYQMLFETGHYFSENNITGFYPEVGIQFTVFDDSHYHVPLLINPFGYSTYRGS